MLALPAGLLVAGTAAATPAGASGAALTLYSGQHVQTTQALVNAFEKKTGITVNVRFDDEDVLADQIVSRGRPLAGRRVLHRELAAPPVPGLQAPARPDQGVDAGADTLEVQLAERPVGRRLGPGERHRLQHVAAQGRASCRPRPCSWPQPKWKGKIAIAGGETDFQPIVTSVARTYGNAAALRWLEALKANAGSHQYPDNETIADEVNRGQVALGIVNQYYWYRERAEIGASNMHSAIAYFAPARRRLRRRRLGRRRPALVAEPGRRRSASWPSSPRPRGSRSSPTATSFEYPIASGVTTAQPETPFNQLQPNPITIAQLGTGAEAIKLLQEAQLL